MAPLPTIYILKSNKTSWNNLEGMIPSTSWSTMIWKPQMIRIASKGLVMENTTAPQQEW